MEALHFGPIAGAATPAAVAAAMPQSGGAAQRRGDIASLALEVMGGQTDFFWTTD